MFLGKLYPSQIEGAEFLCREKRGILAYEQGLGKTVIAIASAEKLLELSLIQTVLIIAPSAICWQWENKIQELTDAQSSLITAKSPERETYDTNSTYVVVSYNLFRRDYDKILKHKWDLVICDEAQEFKNNKSKTAKLLKALNNVQGDNYRWALTGTVISNKLEELYSIMFWVEKSFLPPWPVFEKRHVKRNSHTKQIIGYKSLEQLTPYLKKKLSRKTHKDMADKMPSILPPKIYKVAKHKELIRAEKDLLKELDRMVEELQFADDGSPRAAKDSAVAKAFHAVQAELQNEEKLNLAKKLCQGILEENPQNRVVVFNRFKDPLYRLGDKLGDVFYFTGDQSQTMKQWNVEMFRKMPSTLLASNAGAAGLDLPFANYLIHLDVPPSWGILDQREKRITRASSEFKFVVVNYLIIEDSLEEFYYDLVRRKGQLAQAVYTGNTPSIEMRPQSLRQFLHDHN